MRPEAALRLAATAPRHYWRLKCGIHSPQTALDRFRSLFGDDAMQLPRSLCLELMTPALRQTAMRRSLFEKLDTLGRHSLDLELNSHLGTQNVELSDVVLTNYAKEHKLASYLVHLSNKESSAGSNSHSAVSLLTASVGAIEGLLGREICHEVLASIVGGRRGLANVYLESFYLL